MFEKLGELNRIYDDYRDEVNIRNAKVIGYMIHGGIPLSIAVILTQGSMQYYSAMMLALRLLIYFLFLFALFRPILARIKNQTLLLYLLQVPVLVMVLLMGTFMDPEHQAITIFVFMSALPASILDKPIHIVAWIVGWMALFVGCSYYVKEFNVFRGDFLYALEFGATSMMVSVVITTARMKVIRDLKVALKRIEELEGNEKAE